MYVPPRVAAAGAAALAAGAAAAFVHHRRRPKDPPLPMEVERDDPVRSIVGEKFRCACGQRYRTTGEGRHRVYWVDDARIADPVLERECVSCGTDLPHEHAVA